MSKMFGRLFSNSRDSSSRDSNSREPPETRVRLLSGETAVRSRSNGSIKALPAPSKTNKAWIEKPKFTDFNLGPCLGTGSFGRVHLAHYVPNNNQLCATKALSKATILKMKQVIHVKQEKGILKEIDHPFIVNLIGYCQDEKFVYLIMEYVCGGEFFTYLRTTGRFDETTARFYAAQVLISFEYLHSMDIIYRDLKPENLLLDEKGNLKIADFGFAKKIDRRTYTLCGTPDYLAPEIILNKGHGKPVDWWAFGVLIYEMLAGYPPFYDDDVSTCHEKILKGDVKYPKQFSDSAKDLIKKLLEADLTKRIGCLKSGATEVKSHAWFSTLDWNNVMLKKDVPPIRPKVSGPEDSTCFDDYSKIEPIKHDFVLTAEDQKQFADF
ncbi:unnamed protein product [Calypogeia fissa]